MRQQQKLLLTHFICFFFMIECFENMADSSDEEKGKEGSNEDYLKNVKKGNNEMKNKQRNKVGNENIGENESKNKKKQEDNNANNKEQASEITPPNKIPHSEF